MIFMEAVVLQHSVELLKILNVTLERNLLLPATCSIQIFRGHREHSTALFISSLISHSGVTLSLAVTAAPENQAPGSTVAMTCYANIS